MKCLSIIAITTIFGLASVFCGCDGGSDDSGSFDIGDNDPNLIVCIGDSITQGYACEGLPYPSNLAALTGKTVRNAGVGGTIMADGIASAKAALGVKPGYMCIMYGANDAIHSIDPADIVNSLQTIIELCRENKTIPIVGLVPPQTGEHAIFNPNVVDINVAIMNKCGAMGVICVNVYGAFGSTPEIYLTSDGLHTNPDGSMIIAQQFAACF